MKPVPEYVAATPILPVGKASNVQKYIDKLYTNCIMSVLILKPKIPTLDGGIYAGNCWADWKEASRKLSSKHENC